LFYTEHPRPGILAGRLSTLLPQAKQVVSTPPWPSRRFHSFSPSYPGIAPPLPRFSDSTSKKLLPLSAHSILPFLPPLLDKEAQPTRRFKTSLFHGDGHGVPLPPTNTFPFSGGTSFLVKLTHDAGVPLTFYAGLTLWPPVCLPRGTRVFPFRVSLPPPSRVLIPHEAPDDFGARKSPILKPVGPFALSPRPRNLSATPVDFSCALFPLTNPLIFSTARAVSTDHPQWDSPSVSLVDLMLPLIRVASKKQTFSRCYQI